jgi:DNA-binding HxlR family transcriptional regulator
MTPFALDASHGTFLELVPKQIHLGPLNQLPAKNHPETGTALDASAQHALALLADRWNFMIIREVYGGVFRYGQMQRNLGIARNVLADRLAKLVAQGLLVRVPYRRSPVWCEYRLTERGLGLYPAIVAFFSWAEENFGDPARSTFEIRHRACGRPTRPLLVCSECGEALTAGDVETPATPP